MSDDAPSPTGFSMSTFVREKHACEIWSVAWSTDVFYDDETSKENGMSTESASNSSSSDDEDTATTPTQAQPRQRQVRYLAACGGKYVSIYEVEIPSDDNGDSNTAGCSKGEEEAMMLRQSYVDRDEEETFFACAFGGHSMGRPFGYIPSTNTKDEHGNIMFGNATSLQQPQQQLFQDMADTRTHDGPQLLCVAGTRGVIKVIDTVQQMLFMTLSGHGNEISDLKFSPLREKWLLLSASKDESVRLWNVQTGSCIGIFAGQDGHRDSVLSVAWHPQGECFASGSMDNTVKLWSLREGTNVHAALQASNNLLPKEWDIPIYTEPTANTFKPANEQMPYFSSNKIHEHYVDCVKFVGDLILSKSIHNVIVLWKPILSRPVIRGKKSHVKPSNDITALWEFKMKDCDVWFVRFDTNSTGNLLAVGNRKGVIRVWDLDAVANPKKGGAIPLLTHSHCDSTIRMISFSPDDESLVAACEDSTVWKWDATYE